MIGARQFVVHEACEIKRVVGLRSSSLTPRARVHSISSADGTVKITLLAPEKMCPS